MNPRTLATMGTMLLLGACHRSGAAPTEGPRDAGAAPMVASSVASAAPPRSAAMFPLADGARETFRGSLEGGLAVIATLTRRGDVLEGSYFYETHGIDIALAGKLVAPDTFELEERSAGKVSGRFKGTVRDRTLSGTWSPENTKGVARSFELQPIARRASDPVTLFKKVHRAKRKAKTPNEGAMLKECTVDAEYFAVYGARSPDVDDAINRALRPEARVMGETEPCDVAESMEIRSRVSFNDKNVLSVVWESNWCCGAHPSYARHFVNVATTTGAAFKLGDTFRDHDAKKLKMLVRSAVAKRFGEIDSEGRPDAIDEAIREVLDRGVDFAVVPSGLELSLFNTQPHVIQSAFDKGFVVPWTKIEKTLDPAGPLGAFAKP